MKIAIICDGIMPFVTGGMQKHSFYLAKYLTLNNCDISLYHCVSSTKHPSDDEINKSLFDKKHKLNKIITFTFPKSIWFPGHYFFNSYRYSKKVYKSLLDDNEQYDFIYVKGLAGWKLINKHHKGRISPPIGINFHGMNMFLPVKGLKLKLINIIFKIIVKKNMNRSDFVFSYGSKVSSTILAAGVSTNKIIELPTGIEKQFIRDENKIKVNDKLNFIFIGRNDPVKALKELFISIDKFKESDFNFHFIGPINSNSVKENLKYHGLLTNFSDVINILDSSDVLVLPSYSEGMPNVILEAMSRGLIVVATDVGAVNLMVSQENGILIESPDPNLIEEAIRKILKMNKDEILKMKINSIKKLKSNFLWQKVASTTYEKINNLI